MRLFLRMDGENASLAQLLQNFVARGVGKDAHGIRQSQFGNATEQRLIIGGNGETSHKDQSRLRRLSLDLGEGLKGQVMPLAGG